jgi:hypothetical protein
MIPCICGHLDVFHIAKGTCGSTNGWCEECTKNFKTVYTQRHDFKQDNLKFLELKYEESL